VTLVLFDRVGAGPIPSALHNDVRTLRLRLGFERSTVLHASTHSLVAQLHDGPHHVLSLLRRDGAHLELQCEVASAPKERQA
jgi:hypothetical protein